MCENQTLNTASTGKRAKVMDAFIKLGDSYRFLKIIVEMEGAEAETS